MFAWISVSSRYNHESSFFPVGPLRLMDWWQIWPTESHFLLPEGEMCSVVADTMYFKCQRDIRWRKLTMQVVLKVWKVTWGRLFLTHHNSAQDMISNIMQPWNNWSGHHCVRHLSLILFFYSDKFMTVFLWNHLPSVKLTIIYIYCAEFIFGNTKINWHFLLIP